MTDDAEVFQFDPRHELVPIQAIEELQAGIVNASTTDELGVARNGSAILLDLVGRSSGTTERKGYLALLTPEVAGNLIGELVRVGSAAWGDDLARIIERTHPLALETLRRT